MHGRSGAGIATLVVVLLGTWAAPLKASPPPAAADSLALFEAAGRWADAERAAGESVETLERDARVDSLALARMLLRQAAAGRSRGQLADGRTVAVAERAVRVAARLRPADPLLHCQALSLASLLRIDLAEGDSALARVRQALAIAGGMRPASDSVEGGLYLREGQAQRVRGDHAAAIDAYRRSSERAVRRLGPDAAGIGAIATEMGRSFTQLGEYDSARTRFVEAVRIGERNRGTSTRGLELALGSFAGLERRAGDPARAVELSTRAYELCVARQGEETRDAWSFLSNVATAYFTLGDFPRARALLEEVLRVKSAFLPAAHPDQLLDRVTLAMTFLRTGDRERARAELDRVDSLRAGADSDATLAAYATTVRTGLDLEELRFAEARRQLREAAARAPAMPATHVDLAARLLETVREPGDASLADSLGRLVDAWAESTEVARTKNWTMLLVDRAQAEARLGRRAAAWEHAREAEAIARERFRWEVRALPDRAALLHDEEAADPSQSLVELADPGRPEHVRVAWEAVMSRRGAVREAVEARRPPISGGDSALAGAHARWIGVTRHHAQQLVAGAFDEVSPDARARFESSRAAVEDAERRYAVLAAGAVPPSPTLAAVQSRLRAGEALVAFVHVERNFEGPLLDAFVVRGDGSAPRLVPLGPEAALAARLEAWWAALSAPPPADARGARAAEARAREAGTAVRRAVWDPLAAAIGAATDVHVVAAGPVRDLPWLALPAGGGRYLAETGPTVHVRLAERDLLRPEARPRRAGLLVVGDPDFDGTDRPGHPGATLRRLPGLCGRAGVVLGPLPGAREEARAIARSWEQAGTGGEARLLLGADATELRFKELAFGRRVIHLATHGILARDSCGAARPGSRGVGGVAEIPAGRPAGRRASAAARPAVEPRPAASPWIGRDAWLAFAGANRAGGDTDDGNEGWLTADEVSTLDLRGTERVVLSACQSGVAERWTEEAVLGMRRAFHLAGARCVVASSWPVADEATREWMIAFHASAAATAGGALRDAACTVIARRRAAGRPPHPFYWAAFTATGD